ncbi:hypothetical protein [Bradyrhizobium sp. CER78]|uniref:hypothetical protein n=1 Tax=Bradyrhizobium sp. CER78 TaxID=3039162 RepID=UPI00244BE8D4|nr:hypothetical protein [Bradyrhizobium sp. CER78]MDH2386114.1 hypothetical protein [Bradyrhizobium sp. CER78]
MMCLADAGAGARAQSNGIAGDSPQLAQAKTSSPGDAGPAGAQAQSVDGLTRELATARRDVELLQGLLTKERENSVQVENALQGEVEKLRKSLKDIPQGTAVLQKSLQGERDHAAQLEQDLATARRDVDTLAAMLVKANDETAKLKQASQGGNADLQKPLAQERERAAKLEQDLAAARRDVETQTALAVKASDETAQLKKASQSGAADVRKSLEQEQKRAAKLEQELAAARRDVETQTALAVKASDETAQLKKASQSGAVDVQKSLAQEHERAAKLEKDLAAARRDVETQTALAAKASDEAARLKKASQSGAVDVQKSLAQEHERAAKLELDLAAARRDVETQTALAAKASEETAQLKKASQSGAADVQKSLEQEQKRAAKLEQDLAAARRDVETQSALAAKAGDETAKLKAASQSGAADSQKLLEQEQKRAAKLELDLAAARRDVEAQSALAAKAGDELAKLKLTTEAGTVELRRSMQKEHERGDALARDLSTARSKVYAYEAQAAQASDEAAKRKQAESNETAELRQSLQREQQRAEALTRDLATKKSELDALAKRAAEANLQAAGMKQAAEQAVAEQRSLLQRERGRTEQLERDLASARRDMAAFAVKVPPVASQVATTGNAGRPIQEEPAGAAVAPPQDRAAAARTAGNAAAPPDDGAQEARLLARARLLLERGDIGGARVVLESVAETGSAQASFALAETYDPLTLSNWGTYGTRGDAAKARDLYAKAEAGGIKEAKARFEALR